ncbi:hypothetical protein ETAE_2427 [Edwardsiella piscicida]|uniref:Uncharacterized protein n=2 Tax=Edwardsiella TaxID=635 RepID=A0A0H3DUH7_EDWTF|nr:hypothetical protein ETAE_2427 [Edwardsiella tarda EIB202]ADM42302.1 hypothetical protein ETAF_2197 [Edwardsiella tarda FL6-60]
MKYLIFAKKTDSFVYGQSALFGYIQRSVRIICCLFTYQSLRYQ